MTEVFLPKREGETDDERRFREAMDRLCGQMVTTIDAALRTRSLPQEGKRNRHKAIANLKDMAIHARAAFDYRNMPQD